MPISIAYLGPPGTYAEAAALACAAWLTQTQRETPLLIPYPSIFQTLQATASHQTQLTVVPVENSIEGSVSITLDTLWQLDTLRIQQAIVLPISHALLSHAASIEAIQSVHSHPQALAQCQGWLEKHLPTVKLIPTSSTTEALQHLDQNISVGAIASQRAAQLYRLPILAHPINDHPDNCTRFWVMGLQNCATGSHSSLAFSLPQNVPGSLVKLLQIFADRNINLSRIESRPTKRSLGEYLFFIDVEASLSSDAVQSALHELREQTETLKIFGTYSVMEAQQPS
ncbi:MAG: prephenate dehydratase [Elainellaceae cyanobacterium]